MLVKERSPNSYLTGSPARPCFETNQCKQVEDNWLQYYGNYTGPQRSIAWFASSGEFNGTKGKSLNSCGNSLPRSLNPRCDPFLGLTQGCECSGKNVVNFVTVKPLDLDKDSNAVRNAANVAAFASGDKLSAKVTASRFKNDC